VDAKKDGKPNIYSYMDGTKFVRIEIDNDEDGKIDRWEYYGAESETAESRVSRGTMATSTRGRMRRPTAQSGKVEVSTLRNGKVDRTEFYEKGVMVRAQVESDGTQDRQVGNLRRRFIGHCAFDTKRTGSPIERIDYRRLASRPGK